MNYPQEVVSSLLNTIQQLNANMEIANKSIATANENASYWQKKADGYFEELQFQDKEICRLKDSLENQQTEFPFAGHLELKPSGSVVKFYQKCI